MTLSRARFAALLPVSASLSAQHCRTPGAALGLGALLLALTAACGADSFATDSPDAAGADAGGSDAPVAAGNCDAQHAFDGAGNLKKACVSDAVGVFVSAASGSDSNPGTQASPVKTITRALTLNRLSSPSSTPKRVVYVCAGSYPESPVIDTTAAIVVGGFNCDNWSLAANDLKKSEIIPPPNSAGDVVGVTIKTQNVTLAGFTITAGDTSAPGASSVGVWVGKLAKSANLSLLTVTTGNGKDGAPGVTASNYSGGPNPSAQNGANAVGATGGNATVCMCKDGTSSTGGGGGNAGGPNSPGAAGTAGLPSVQIGWGRGGAGGSASGSGTAQSGEPGYTKSPDGLPCTPSQSYGYIADPGWHPGQGAKGLSGAPGQGGGGGGGAGNQMSGGGGAGGGCGGCGGAGGGSGNGGGGSIGVLVSADASLSLSTITTKNGGNGGDAALPENGQAGGAGASAPSPAGSGGPGGAGGRGSPGQGGPGGLSAGLVAAPAVVVTVDQFTKITVGNAGTPGQGGGGTGALAPAKDIVRFF